MIPEPNHHEELLKVIKFSTFVSDTVSAKISPFRDISLLKKFQQRLFLAIIKIFERMFNKRLYVNSNLGSLSNIDVRSRHLLADLLNRNIVQAWSFTDNAPDLPNSYHCQIELTKPKLANGSVLTIFGNRGEGTGINANEALLIALAETLERYGLIVTTETRAIRRGSQRKLSHLGAVNLDRFKYFRNDQLSKPALSRYRVDNTTELSWVSAINLLNDSPCLIPAHLISLIYDQEYPNENILYSSSSNGAAAAQTKDLAIYKGILELIERDALMYFWLNKVAPLKLDLDSVCQQNLSTLISDFSAHRLELSVLDISSDFGVPVYCAVVVDRYGRQSVSISAVSGFDVGIQLRKLLLEVLKHIQVVNTNRNRNHPLTDRFNSNNPMEKRRQYWSKPSSIPDIEFFLTGTVVTYDDFTRNGSTKNYSPQITRDLLSTFRNKNYDLYVADITPAIARQVGLSVVKVICPQLIDLHFTEDLRCLGKARLYQSISDFQNLSREDVNKREFNPIPHPFL